ncbi:MAG TPA: signal recognition particle protein [bacterium]|mgnify:FL=1|nr:signal recognition particle protein [bacterium]HQN72745.1 signal recognition particle protein [bacterium]HQO90884.1 signal recognition particle protein [bacterium]
MFDQLTEKLESTFKKLRGVGKLTEENISEGIRELKLSLLEADVNFKVVKELIEKVKERALGADVMKSITPGQMFIKIFHEELVSALGEGDHSLNISVRPPAVILMAGLQGSGKTTTAAKLASMLKNKQKKRVVLVPADVYRPAAIDQLKKLGSQIGVDVYPSETGMDPVDIAKKSIEFGKNIVADVIIIDTAGRMQIDVDMMDEITNIKNAVEPSEILFVADAMTGQDAVNVAAEFHRRLTITGIVLTKMDGDARGGAALSINAVTGAPVKFVGVGEKIDQFELFHPERIAGRIVGMGDILSLVEKAGEKINTEEALRLQKKMVKNSFDLEDFLSQMKMIKGMGPMEDMLGMIPGIGKEVKKIQGKVNFEKELSRIEAIIFSMTKEERRKPEILNASRRRRIANGSGTRVQDINQFMKQYLEMKKMMSNLNRFGLGGLMKKFKGIG